MNSINVTSEIKPLKKVLLHRPGNELLNLTPDNLEELLFDDIPFLKKVTGLCTNMAYGFRACILDFCSFLYPCMQQ